MSSAGLDRSTQRAIRHHRRPDHELAGPAGERGLSLVIALGFIASLGIVIAAILTYAQASSASQAAFRTERARRYAADAAIEQAVAWAKGQPKVGIDPLGATPTPCILKVPAVAGTATRPATPAIDVTCAADSGGGSGLPKDLGLVPDYTILTTGQRDKEVRPFTGSSCVFETGKKNYDAALGALSTLGTARTEYGIRFSRTSAACIATRAVNQWTVRGKVFSNSAIVANPGGSIKLADANSSVSARGGCQNITACTTVARTNLDPMDPTAVMSDGGHDPRTDNCAASGVRSDGLTKQEYCDSWKLPDIASLPTGVVPSASNCGPGKVVVFEPGYYKNIGDLNALFKNTACKDTTFWFAPARGNGQLLGPGYKTGLYYFDFTDGVGGGCNYYTSSSSTNHQWCIGDTWNTNQHVVAGTPKGWNPFGGGGGAVSTPPLTTASVDGLRTSPFWDTSGGKANTINGTSATYNNALLAIDRRLTLKGFGPRVSSGAYTGAVDIEVAHAETSGFSTPQITVRYDTTLFGSKSCGTFNLTKNATLHTDHLSPADQTALGNCLNQGDKINGVSVTFTVGGCNFLWCGSSLSLDGMRITPGSFPSQPTFPRPVTGSDTGGDCDPTKPGAMFIFGGDSHVYVADGSLEICAGPAPELSSARQEIAVYGVPAPLPVRASSAAKTTKAGNTDNVNGTGVATRIAEPLNTDPNAGLEMGDWGNIQYSGGNCGFCSPTVKGGMDLTFPGFDLTKYPGTRIKKVWARASNNTNVFSTGPQLELPACSPASNMIDYDPSLNFGEFLGSALEIVGQQSKFRQQTKDVTSCMSSRIASGSFTATWWARGQYVCGFGICSDRSFEDQLDGVEFIVELEKDPSATGVVAVPQNGCVTNAPNYWNTAQGGESDCALVKADQTKTVAQTVSGERCDKVPASIDHSCGRFSAKGTIYAPSAALDIDDEDVLYPFFSRGLVARTLMLRGFRYRIETPVADVPTLDKSQNPREATFTACVRGAGRSAETGECNSGLGDVVLARARVRFEAQSDWPDPPTRARVPKIQWWSVNR